MREYDELRERALAALRFDQRLAESAPRLDAHSLDGLLRLTGMVEQPWQKFRAQWVVQQVPGVERVENLVEVTPAAQRTDQEIAQEVVRVFLQDPYLDERAIQAEVTEGVVHLRGRVPSLLRKRLAGVLAWWCPSVRDVVNELEVEPPDQDSNEELAEAIKAVLEKDPLVDGSAVAVHVTDAGEVTLTGAVLSPVERTAAENDAWCVLGVAGVNNHIAVVPPTSPTGRFGPGR